MRARVRVCARARMWVRVGGQAKVVRRLSERPMRRRGLDRAGLARIGPDRLGQAYTGDSTGSGSQRNAASLSRAAAGASDSEARRPGSVRAGPVV